MSRSRQRPDFVTVMDLIHEEVRFPRLEYALRRRLGRHSGKAVTPDLIERISTDAAAFVREILLQHSSCALERRWQPPLPGEPL